MKKRILVLIVAALVLGACGDERMRRRDLMRDERECVSKGGLFIRGAYNYGPACFAVDSIIPLTGPREAINLRAN